MTKDFAVFDADSHVVEPPALWEKYLEPEYRSLGRHALWRQEGRTVAYLKINGEIFRDKGHPNLPRHALWRPGMTWDAIGELDPHIRHKMTEGASGPQARLADMDAMGVDQSLLYPTWFAEGFFLCAIRTWPMRWPALTTTGSLGRSVRRRAAERSASSRDWSRHRPAPHWFASGRPATI